MTKEQFQKLMDLSLLQTAEIERLREFQRDVEEAEGRCCPEDVGFEEWIGVLKKRLADAEAKLSKYVVGKPKLRVQLVGPYQDQIEKAWASKIANEGDVRLCWIVEADLWPLDGRYEVQEFKAPAQRCESSAPEASGK